MAGLEDWWQKQARTRTLWQLLLWPCSLLFGLLVVLRRMAYGCGVLSTMRLPVPVIVVGSISVGGTGKTPLVIWLVRYLQQHGYSPVVIGHGYRSWYRAGVHILQAHDTAASVGDEALLLTYHVACPVVIGRNRPVAAHVALALNPDCNVLVCDDGLQHYALTRSMEIAVVNGEQRYGNGSLLPAGSLREPVCRLRDVDAIVVQGGAASPGEYAMRLLPKTLRQVKDRSRIKAVASLGSRPVHAVAGIGHPERFFSLLQQQGLHVIAHAFPDHHRYQLADFAAMDATVVMTEKDAVKCSAFAQDDWWYLDVEVEVDVALGQAVLNRLRSQV